MHNMANNVTSFGSLKVTGYKKLRGEQSSFEPALMRKKALFLLSIHSGFEAIGSKPFLKVLSVDYQGMIQA